MMVGAWWIWPVAVLAYVVFRLWYDNWRGPLTAQEIDAFMAQIAASSTGSTTEASVVRAFLEADDGKEFVMSNLVGLHTQPVTHPETGAQTSALEVMQEYGRRFVPMLFRHGGHPLLAMRKVGGYVDSWQTPPDPGWHIVGAMRYRSRRDMMRLPLETPSSVPIHMLFWRSSYNQRMRSEMIDVRLSFSLRRCSIRADDVPAPSKRNRPRYSYVPTHSLPWRSFRTWLTAVAMSRCWSFGTHGKCVHRRVSGSKLSKPDRVPTNTPAFLSFTIESTLLSEMVFGSSGSQAN